MKCASGNIKLWMVTVVFITLYAVGLQCEYIPLTSDIELYAVYIVLLAELSALLVYRRLWEKVCGSLTVYRAEWLVFVLCNVLFSLSVGFNPILVVKSISIVVTSVISLAYCSTIYGRKNISAALGIVCALMAAMGLVRYCLYFGTGHPEFAMSFPFDNPCGYGILLAVLFPYAVRFLVKRHVVVCAVVISAIVVALLLSESRAAIVAAVAGVVFSEITSRRKKYIVLIGVCFIVICVCMYFMKPVSANGRLLIWRVGLGASVKHWLFGGGSYAFEKEYMYEQASFFACECHREWIMIADNVSSPFNEYLLVFMRYGIVGIGVCSAFAAYVGKKVQRTWQNDKHAPLGAVTAAATASLFSYPLSYHVIVIVIVASVVMLMQDEERNIKCGVQGTRYGAIVPVCTLLVSVLTLYMANMESKRLEIENYAENGGYEKHLTDRYESMCKNPYYRHHPQFLFNYAMYLYECNQYKKSYMILSKYQDYSCDYEVVMMQAYLLELMGDENGAIRLFKVARSMVPCRMQPRYELIRLCKKNGECAMANDEIIKAKSIPLKVENQKSVYYRKMIDETCL